MTSPKYYDLRREFEIHLARYSEARPNEVHKFTSYLFNLYKNDRIKESLSDFVCLELILRAKERFPEYPEPRAFLKYLFQDSPESEEIKRRFSGRPIKSKR